MRRTKSLCLLPAVVGLVAACGSSTRDATDFDGVMGESGGTSGRAGAKPSASDAGDDASDGGLCNLPPPPASSLPQQPGCYENDGGGWLSVPCVCDLWLANTTLAPITAGIQFTVTPLEQASALTGALTVDVTFDDLDASWYATWSQQADNGSAFAVANEVGKTTVTMRQAAVTLAPVAIAACQTQKAVAHVSPGSNSAAKLTLHAVLGSGSAATTADSFCSNPPPTY